MIWCVINSALSLHTFISWYTSFLYSRFGFWGLLQDDKLKSLAFVWPNWIYIFSQGKTALHLVSLGGAHGWTANLERQESLKDFRAVAFEAVHYHSVRIDNHDLIIYHISYIVIIMRSNDCPSTTRLIIRRTGVGFQCVLLMALALMIMNDPNIHHVHPFILERPPPHFDSEYFAQTMSTLSTCCIQPSSSGHPESRQSGWQCRHRRCQGLDGIVMCIVHQGSKERMGTCRNKCTWSLQGYSHQSRAWMCWVNCNTLSAGTAVLWCL